MHFVGKFMGLQSYQSEKMSQPARNVSIEGVRVSVPEGVQVPPAVSSAVGHVVTAEVVQAPDFRGNVGFMLVSIVPGVSIE